MKSPAIVSYKSVDGKSLNWKYETVTVRENLNPDEVLVEMSSVGLCHTDVVIGSSQTENARILGHEGSGIVKKVGSAVANCAPGDPVLLSFCFCKECGSCKKGHKAYCESFGARNMVACETEEESSFKVEDGTWAMGKFFGQSSFSKLSIVDATSVVNLKGFELSTEQMDKLSPLGCGIQTGIGAILNAGRATKGDSVVVYGLGGVGIAAIMAAKIAGCYPIIAVDLLQSKIDMAKDLGATHAIKGGNDEKVHDKILELTGSGADLSLECIGGSRFVHAALNNCGLNGRVVYVGVGPAEDVIEIPSFPFMLAGKQLIGCIEGNAYPPEFVPKMVQWFLEGKLSVDKLETIYPIEDYQRALDDVKSGKAIKPILKF